MPGLVKQTPNSIGYVELIYAVQNKMTYGDVKNAAGKFVKAELRQRDRGRGGRERHAGRFPRFDHQRSGRGSLSDLDFTWLLIPSEIKDPAKKKAITDFLAWMLTDGQKDCAGTELCAAAEGGRGEGTEADRAD